jgi:branched-chain amino acid transport system substrate-binding protein
MRKGTGVIALAVALSLAAGAQAADPYLVGLSGDLSGPSAGTYKPLAEGARAVFDALNMKGGINGHLVKLMTRDNRSDPNQTIADLNFFDSEKASAVILVSTSGTLGGYVKQNKISQIPTLYINACYPPSTPPQADPNFFCPGISTLTDSYAYVDLMGELMGKDPVKLGIITTDIPGARGAAEKIIKPYAEKKGFEVIDVAVMPLATTDATGIARGFMEKGVNAVISYTISSHMLAGAEALAKLGWKGKYLLMTGLPGTFDQLRQIKAENIYGLDHFALMSEDKPIQKEIRATATKNRFDFPLDDIRMGYRSGMVLAAGLEKCGWPCDRDKLRQIMNHLRVDGQDMIDLNLDPVVFSETNHTNPKKTYRVYHWSAEKGDVVQIGKDFVADERDWK